MWPCDRACALRDRVQIFAEKQQFKKWNDSIYIHFLYMDQMWRARRLYHEKYLLFYLTVQGKNSKNYLITVGSRSFNSSAIVPTTSTMRSVRSVLKLCRYNLFYFSFFLKTKPTVLKALVSAGLISLVRTICISFKYEVKPSFDIHRLSTEDCASLYAFSKLSIINQKEIWQKAGYLESSILICSILHI